MKVLIDTSIWSLAFRKAKKDQSEQQIIEKLQNLIKDHRAMIIGPIRQELLSGISSKSTFKKLKTLLEAFPDVILNPSSVLRTMRIEAKFVEFATTS